MDRQSALFTDMEQRPADTEPRGFRYREEIVTEEEEAALVASLGQLDLKPFEFHGHLGNRKVASFGLKYDFSRRSVERASDMPAFLGNLIVRVAEFAGYETDLFRQVGVNEYRPDAGIGWHKDKSQLQARLPGLIVVCSGRSWSEVSQVRGTWGPHLSGRTHFHCG